MFFTRSGKRRSSWFLIATVSVMLVSSFFLVSKGTAATPVTNTNPVVSSSSLGEFAPTFAGPAATGCDAFGCALLTGPFFTSTVEPLASLAAAASSPNHHALPLPSRPRRPVQAQTALAITLPTVSCEPLGSGCDTIDSSSEGAVGVKGLNAVDSAEQAPTWLVTLNRQIRVYVPVMDMWSKLTTSGRFWFSIPPCSGNQRSSRWTRYGTHGQRMEQRR